MGYLFSTSILWMSNRGQNVSSWHTQMAGLKRQCALKTVVVRESEGSGVYASLGPRTNHHEDPVASVEILLLSTKHTEKAWTYSKSHKTLQKVAPPCKNLCILCYLERDVVQWLASAPQSWDTACKATERSEIRHTFKIHWFKKNMFWSIALKPTGRCFYFKGKFWKSHPLECHTFVPWVGEPHEDQNFKGF